MKHEDEARRWFGSLAVIKLAANQTEGCTFDAGPGDTAFGPRDVPHRYRVGPDGCRMLFILTPGGFEGAIRAMSTPAATRTLPPASEGPPDMTGLEDTIASYGCKILEQGDG